LKQFAKGVHLQPNKECTLCAQPIYRNPSEIKQSKSGLFFCCYEHKSQYIGGSQYNEIPISNAIFIATLQSFKNQKWNSKDRKYLAEIILYKPSDDKIASPYITILSKVNGEPKNYGISSEPTHFIRQCFQGVSIKDIHSLPLFIDEINLEWKRLHLRYWNDKCITYEIW
jgi:hypothetical protein